MPPSIKERKGRRCKGKKMKGGWKGNKRKIRIYGYIWEMREKRDWKDRKLNEKMEIVGWAKKRAIKSITNAAKRVTRWLWQTREALGLTAARMQAKDWSTPARLPWRGCLMCVMTQNTQWTQDKSRKMNTSPSTERNQQATSLALSLTPRNRLGWRPRTDWWWHPYPQPSMRKRPKKATGKPSRKTSRQGILRGGVPNRRQTG